MPFCFSPAKSQRVKCLLTAPPSRGLLVVRPTPSFVPTNFSSRPVHDAHSRYNATLCTLWTSNFLDVRGLEMRPHVSPLPYRSWMVSWKLRPAATLNLLGTGPFAGQKASHADPALGLADEAARIRRAQSPPWIEFDAYCNASLAMEHQKHKYSHPRSRNIKRLLCLNALLIEVAPGLCNHYLHDQGPPDSRSKTGTTVPYHQRRQQLCALAWEKGYIASSDRSFEQTKSLCVCLHARTELQKHLPRQVTCHCEHRGYF